MDDDDDDELVRSPCTDRMFTRMTAFPYIGALPLYSDPWYDYQDTTAFLYILYQRLQVRLDGHFCAVHAAADMLRSACLTYLCLCYACS